MSSERGFTLIEVLLATAIMSIGIVSALELFSGSMMLAGKSAGQTRALIVGRSVMDGVLWESDIKETSKHGVENGYRWSLDVYPVEPSLVDPATQDQSSLGLKSSVNFSLMEVAVKISWDAPTGSSHIDLRTERLVEADAP